MPGYQGKAPSFATWTERVNQALKTLDVIDEIETMFEEPMIICDMKHEHFGLSKHNRVKILDSDSIHMKSVAGTRDSKTHTFANVSQVNKNWSISFSFIVFSFFSTQDRSVGDGSHCTQHSDCDFLDCRGVCDLVEETCAKGSVVQNDNLQLLCEKVFQGIRIRSCKRNIF